MIRRTGSILLIFSFFLSFLPSQFLPFLAVFFLALIFFFYSFFLLHCLDAGIVDRVSFSSFLYRGLPFFGDGHRDKGM